MAGILISIEPMSSPSKSNAKKQIFLPKYDDLTITKLDSIKLGTSRNDTINGGSGNDIILGARGDDTTRYHTNSHRVIPEFSSCHPGI